MLFSKPVVGFALRSRRRVNDCARVSNARAQSRIAGESFICQARSHPRSWGMPLMTDRIKEFLARNHEDGPRLIVDLDVVRAEVTATRKLYEQQGWPAIDVSRRSVEETAASVLNLLAERHDL